MTILLCMELPLFSLGYRINTSLTTIPEILVEPSNSVKWDDFSPFYQDDEIGLVNPVDVKVNSVSCMVI